MIATTIEEWPMRPYAILASIVIIAASAVSGCAPDSSRSTNHYTVGCAEWGTFYALTRFAAKSEIAALFQLLAPKLEDGSCIEIDKGTRVYIVDSDPALAAACVRPEGKTKCYWVANKIID